MAVRHRVASRPGRYCRTGREIIGGRGNQGRFDPPAVVVCICCAGLEVTVEQIETRVRIVADRLKLVETTRNDWPNACATVSTRKRKTKTDFSKRFLVQITAVVSGCVKKIRSSVP